jgi:hypothetical protein
VFRSLPFAQVAKIITGLEKLRDRRQKLINTLIREHYILPGKLDSSLIITLASSDVLLEHNLLSEKFTFQRWTLHNHAYEKWIEDKLKSFGPNGKIHYCFFLMLRYY